MDISIVTCSRVPQLVEHEVPLLQALTARGISAEARPWDDPQIDWSQTPLTLVRATWGYYLKYTEFLHWIEHVSQVSTLWNPAEILRWNTHKTYLRDLEERGVAGIPTIWLSQGSPVSLASLLAQRAWKQAVIKPAVSASAHATMLVTEEKLTAGQAHLDAHLAHGDMLVQPFLSSIVHSPERSLIFIDGEFTHAVKRVPALGLNPEATVSLITPDPEEIAFAYTVLSKIPFPLLFARVDLLRDETGTLRLMELELVEPDLWLGFAPHAVERFADALMKKIRVMPRK